MSTIAPLGISGLLVHLAPLFAAVLFAAWWGITRAPEGYQDDDGFHYGPEPSGIDWDRWEGSE